MNLGWRAWLLAALLIGVLPVPTGAQVFLGSRPHPEFEIGPLFVRASVTPALGPVTVDVLWSLEIPPTRSALELEQDLYILWPGEVDGLTNATTPDRAISPMYFEHRDRVVRLGDAPAELVVNFADADHLKINEVFPRSSTKRLSESLERTEVVSLFLEKSRGTAPQQLTVEFGYFSGLQALAPILIPLVFFVLGNFAGPVLQRVALNAARRATARVLVGRPHQHPRGRQSGVILSRDALARIVPGETTYDDVIQICGPNAEHHEQLVMPGRRTLVYRGRRIIPNRTRTIGWLATVSHWDLEDHTTQIELEDNRVRDIQAHVRRSRLPAPELLTQ